MKKINITLILAALAALFTSCAKTVSEDEKAELREYFLAWMAQNHPGVSANENGIYILEETQGRGLSYENQSYAFLEVTLSDIEGNISSTNNEQLSKQLGTYVVSNYYGPTMHAAGDAVNSALYYTLYGMKRGGTRTAIAPFWLVTYDRYNTVEEYYKHAKTSSSSASALYTVKMLDFTNDVEQWEIDSLQMHLRHFYKEEPDSVAFGRYYYQLEAPSSTKDFPSDTTIYINYTGRLLNGQVFDTTIKDTAIVHNIYSASKTYGPQSVKWASNAEGITLGTSSVIQGFYNTLWQMHPHEKGRGYFISSQGYSSSGSGNNIPAYSPLCFEIEIVDKP